MLRAIFDEIKTLLKKGIEERGHPFRYCTVATVNTNLEPQQRIMVFRELTESLQIILYTDDRSSKILQLTTNTNSSLLFYDTTTKTQITINGTAKILDKTTIQERWNTITGNSQNDYCTINAPGTAIQHPEEVGYSYKTPHFAVIQIQPNTIEYLQLNTSKHIKALFTLQEDEWKGTFATP